MPAQSLTFTFNYTGSTQTWRVPNHIPGSLRFRVVGGKGGDFAVTSNNNSFGGPGGHILGELDIARGTTITVDLGGAGGDSNPSNATPGTAGGGPRPGGQGGLHGGPSGTSATGAGGGGGSELRVSSTVLAVAGGGAGGGRNNATGGNITGPGGGVQTNNGGATTATGFDGFGGTLSAAGAGGPSSVIHYPTWLEAGHDGSGDTGGDGASYILGSGSPAQHRGGGGGGGGGYYGGGGGGGRSAGGGGNRSGFGGGGSSWSSSTYVTEGGTTPAAASSPTDGYVVFEWCPAGGIYVDGAVHF